MADVKDSSMWSALKLKNLSVEEVAAMPQRHRFLCGRCARGVGTWVNFHSCVHLSSPAPGSPEFHERKHYFLQQGWFLVPRIFPSELVLQR